MGRPRGFDEQETVRSAASLFASRGYDGISVDDLVNHLGVHRNSLYKVFGSKRGLYLAALRWNLQHRVRPLLARIGAATGPGEAVRRAAEEAGDGLDLLLMAAVERAPEDPEVAAEVAAVLGEFDDALQGSRPTGENTGIPPAPALAAAVLGLRVRARAAPAAVAPATTTVATTGTDFAEWLDHHRS